MSIPIKGRSFFEKEKNTFRASSVNGGQDAANSLLFLRCSGDHVSNDCRYQCHRQRGKNMALQKQHARTA